MSGNERVATLTAAAGCLVGAHVIGGFVAAVGQAGGRVTGQRMVDGGRAVDLTFIGAVPHFQPDDCDCLMQPAANRRKKILIADMESTVIGQEMLDELAAMIGIGERVAAITKRAMNGELDFAAALRERVALLAGQPQALLDGAAARMTVNPGAADLVAAMRAAGGTCWLVSGGFAFFVRIIAERLGFDRFFANELAIEGGRLTGRIMPPILDKDAKQDLLRRACAAQGCTPADTIAVGDGANDLPMLLDCQESGGLGVAYRAKPNVLAQVTQQINHSDFSALIYAQGLTLSGW